MNIFFLFANTLIKKKYRQKEPRSVFKAFRKGINKGGRTTYSVKPNSALVRNNKNIKCPNKAIGIKL